MSTKGRGEGEVKWPEALVSLQAMGLTIIHEDIMLAVQNGEQFVKINLSSCQEANCQAIVRREKNWG